MNEFKEIIATESALENFFRLPLASCRKNYYSQIRNQLREIKQNEIELGAQSLILGTLFESSPSILILLSQSHEILYTNKKGLNYSTSLGDKSLLSEIFGCSASQDARNNCGKNLACKSCQLRAIIQQSFAKERDASEQEVYIQLHGEEKQNCFLVTTRLVDIRSHEAVLLSATDITELKNNEQRIEEQKRAITINTRIANAFLSAPQDNLFQATLNVILESLESTIGAFGYITENGDICYPAYINTTVRNTEQLSHAHSDTILRHDWSDLLHHSLVNQKVCLSNRRTGLELFGIFMVEALLSVPIIHRDKVIGHFILANKDNGYDEQDKNLLVRVAEQTASILHATLTEEKQREENRLLQRQYLQAQKLESIGRLAGGISHDLNNMLSPILGYGEILSLELEDNSNHKKSAQQIVKAANKASTMIRQLLAYSRNQELKRTVTNINSLLLGFKKLLRRTIREDIEFSFSLDKELPATLADSGQMEQVVLNLAINAQDAMPNGGKLQFRTYKADLTQQDVQPYRGLKPGTYIAIEVEDNGFGMSEDVVGQIFEPFFTTKDKSKGTGLGLSSVYGIVKQHEGNVYVKSTIGKGSIFTIYLPKLDQPKVAEEQETPKHCKSDLSGNETILLVEDNEDVRELANTILERQGYTVLKAENGPHALRIIAETKPKIDLLLTDVIMPKMNGKELYHSISPDYPTLKVLYMSGYTDDILSQQGLLDDHMACIEKPFTIHRLLKTVATLLHS